MYRFISPEDRKERPAMDSTQELGKRIVSNAKVVIEDVVEPLVPKIAVTVTPQFGPFQKPRSVGLRQLSSRADR